MKVICDRSLLAEALNLIGAIVATRTTKPVLTCVELNAEAGQLHLAATNMDSSLHLTLDQVDVQTEGRILVPADKLSAIVRDAIDPTITIESDQEALNISGADAHFKVYAHNSNDFPSVEPFSSDVDFEIQASELTNLIQQTIFATAKETSRYAINGVLLELESQSKKLIMVATDGRRLALAKGTCGSATPTEIQAIIPSKALTLLARLVDHPDSNVRVKIEEHQAHFVLEQATLTTKLVEGNFPPYRDVIPKDHDRKATFRTDILASAIRRASVLTNEESRGTRFNFTGEHLLITSRTPEMGEAEVTVPYEGFTGEPIEIGFNPFFVIDRLKVATEEQVTIELKAPAKPGIIRCGSDFIYVIMPVSL